MRQIAPPGSYHDEREIEAVTELLRTSHLQIGEKVEAFEEKVAALMSKRHGVMVNSGTSANYMALDLLDLAPGDEIHLFGDEAKIREGLGRVDGPTDRVVVVPTTVDADAGGPQ